MTKMREPIQIGAELYGHAGLEADLEVVGLMIAALKTAGVARVHLDLGNPTIYRALTEKAGLNAEDAEALFHAVQQKDAPAARELGGEALATLTALSGGRDVIAKTRKALPSLPAIGVALNALERPAPPCEGPRGGVSVGLARPGGVNYEKRPPFPALT